MPPSSSRGVINSLLCFWWLFVFLLVYFYMYESESHLGAVQLGDGEGRRWVWAGAFPMSDLQHRKAAGSKTPGKMDLFVKITEVVLPFFAPMGRIRALQAAVLKFFVNNVVWSSSLAVENGFQD